MGKFGQIAFPICIASSAFSSLDGDAFVGAVLPSRTFANILTGSRVIYASAKRGDFPAVFATLYGHKTPTPLRALIFEGLSSTTSHACHNHQA